MIEIEDQTVTNKLMQDASKKIRVFQENESGYELISQHGILENRDPDGNLCLYLKKKPFEPVKDVSRLTTMNSFSVNSQFDRKY